MSLIDSPVDMFISPSDHVEDTTEQMFDHPLRHAARPRSLSDRPSSGLRSDEL